MGLFSRNRSVLDIYEDEQRSLKNEARRWFAENVTPRLDRSRPSADITFEAFCVEYLDRWEPSAATRTRSTMREWLAPARSHFGSWKLAELEGAANDVASWRRSLPTDHARYKHTRALRQVLAAAMRWGYIARNPAVNFGKNPQPRGQEINPSRAPRSTPSPQS